ncbi:MAG: serine hydrolase [Novosphingobium sp.]
MTKRINVLLGRIATALMFVAAATAPLSMAQAQDADDFESAFDQAFAPGKPNRSPAPAAPVQRLVAVNPAYSRAAPRNWFESQVAQLADASQGRIGVAAMDLATGRSIGVLSEQPFPMASTSKIAIAATYLDMVDAGRFKLSDQFPMMVPVPSRKFDGPVAPVRPGKYYAAIDLIDLSLTRSDNQATDALLAAVGGPQAVNAWLRKSGISGMRIDRDIATLVRDDGAVNPATTIDARDSATPASMVRLLTGLYQGQWLSAESRDVLLGTMQRCVTGKTRIPALLPGDVRVAHKTGTLSNTASDVGILEAPDGRAIAVAIYVTGQGSKPARSTRIAEIARTLYDNYQYEAVRQRQANAR